MPAWGAVTDAAMLAAPAVTVPAAVIEGVDGTGASVTALLPGVESPAALVAVQFSVSPLPVPAVKLIDVPVAAEVIVPLAMDHEYVSEGSGFATDAVRPVEPSVTTEAAVIEGAAGTGSTVTLEPSVAASPARFVTVTPSVSVPARSGVKVIVSAVAPAVIEPPRIVHWYLAPACT